MSKVKVEMELPELPEGYEYTGEYRRPITSDYFLNIGSDGIVHRAEYGYLAEYPIVRKCEVWRKATLQDVSDALSGKEVVARYSGRTHRLVGGQRRTESWGCPAFLLERENNSTVWVPECEVRVS